MQHNTFRRRMGSLSLVILTLAADLVAAWASFVIGPYVFPAYGIALKAGLAFLGGALSYIHGFFASVGGSLQGGTIFLLFLGAGALLGLLLGILVATRDRYGDVEFAQGLFAFFATVIVALISWFIYGLATHWSPVRGGFSYPQAHLSPSPLSGWICLGSYVLFHLLSYLIQNAPTEHLSRADPKGPIQEQIERCYQRYHTALRRFNPRPISRLVVPVDVYFHEGEGKIITWTGRTLIVPRHLLAPENEGRLLVALARQLMFLNGPDLAVLRFLNSYPQSIATGMVLLFTGNLLILPALVQTVAGARWRGERVLDADRFAFLLGVGVLLRQVLLLEQEELRAQGLKDLDFPTLSERIDQLDALIKDEQQQMQQLGIPVQPAKST